MAEEEIEETPAEEKEITSIQDIKDEYDSHVEDDSDDVGEVDIVAENDKQAAEETPADEESDSEAIAADADTPTTEDYEPDLSYKVNGEEKKFDDRIHSLLKTKEDEEYFREVYQKSEAFDYTKEKLDNSRNEFADLAHTVNSVLDARDSGDYKSMFNALQLNNMPIADALEGLGFDKQAIIQHAYGLATLTQEEEAAYNGSRQLEARNRQLETNQLANDQRFEQIQVQNQQNQLQSELSRPGTTEIVKDFDSKNGNGAFWDEVVSRGIYSFNVTGQDKSARELIDEVVNRFNLGAAPVGTATASTPGQIQAKQDALPVIPNTGVSSKGPSKKIFTSIKELEKEAEDYISSRG